MFRRSLGCLGHLSLFGNYLYEEDFLNMVKLLIDPSQFRLHVETFIIIIIVVVVNLFDDF